MKKNYGISFYVSSQYKNVSQNLEIMRSQKIIFILLLLPFLAFSSSLEYTQKVWGKVTDADTGDPLPGVNILIKGSNKGTSTDLEGKYELEVPSENSILVFSFIGMQSKEVKVGTKSEINIALETDEAELSEVVVTGYAVEEMKGAVAGIKTDKKVKIRGAASPISYSHIADQFYQVRPEPSSNESYAEINENTFKDVHKDPLSTFSIDVDAASYANIRRFINNGQRPPKDAVRIEEMINYFDYSYEQPANKHPFSIYTEVASAPWNEKHQLVHIGLQGKDIPTEDLPPSNLVFLIDVSGSMSSANKLPLLKAGFNMLVDKLRPEDEVSIVVYAGAAGCVLPATSGDKKKEIKAALEKLQSGGSTAGGTGIELAYQMAIEQFKKGGNNRVIMATDGDFNVGASSDKAMEDLIEEKRKDGVFLTVLGFGMGNYKDSKMEVLADKGNGNYAYIDTMEEAKKVFVNEFGGTLFTIAKDVKIQVEFNPANVQAYRLIGYENRVLAAEDFNNDKKDAGEIGSGHSVTALYEVIPVGVESSFKPIDDLKYQDAPKVESSKKLTDELLTVKFRYKKPEEDKSQLIVKTVKNESLKFEKASENLRWSSAVAHFGMILRESDYLDNYDTKEVLAYAKKAKGSDENGYRIELIKMMETFSYMAKN